MKNKKTFKHAHEIGAVDFINKLYDKDDLRKRTARIIKK
jgi:hypothetical protein